MLDWLGVVRMPDPVFMLKFVFDVLMDDYHPEKLNKHSNIRKPRLNSM